MLKIFGIFLFYFSARVQADVLWAGDVYAVGSNHEIADTDINPNNQVLLLPIFKSEIDFRGEVKWDFNQSKIIIRPRWLGYQSISENYATSERHVESKGKIDLTDAFVETHWTRSFSTTIGLQVYQWGPAELLSPSNPIFHFNSSQRSLFYKEKGKVLIRSNLSLNKFNSIVAFVEPISNNEPEWRAESDFTVKALIKYEKSWDDSSQYWGLVTGLQEESNYFIGEYINLIPLESVSIYLDARHSQEKNNFTPLFNGISYDMMSARTISSNWDSLLISGFRFEGRFDFRLEYIFNQAGFEQEELINAISAIQNFLSPLYASNLKRFTKPGLELLGRQYLYSSIRITEPFSISETNIYFRWIHSLQDSSSQIQSEGDYSFADSWTGLIGGSYSIGETNSEFKILNNWSLTAGLKASF
ncbi:MAG: hypothetical protein A2622_02105 [Bdellovibrionales bacterium RIFCSPHIGHO2_01_FULL_40_29]|nr:MAG: hypothetical protein A2622_02105 [Bdellovibrionales bacterium RIFCSPHIGHO2_01_FULL_40_29]OFZ33881.1 MAG: hypothetical protein A3D17_02525 [Bdellovibrionales bacterium RIFCSPHIGHO2_02_FULL_40_15]